MTKTQDIKVIDSLYLHISNSGVTISIKDRGFGPTIEIKTSAFGNINNTTEIFTNKESLKKLAEMFAKAAEEEYSEDYRNLASIMNKDK